MYTTLALVLALVPALVTGYIAGFLRPVISNSEGAAEYIYVNDTDFSPEQYAGLTRYTEPAAAVQQSRRSKRNPAMSGSWYPQSLLVRSMRPSTQLKTMLTDQHNTYRMTVAASDMRYMFWDEELARSAQRHADNCDFRHSSGRRNVGENIWAAPYSDYSDAVRLWWDEVNIPSCYCPNSYAHCCGHYTQVVWAKSYRVGCGAAQCRDIWGVTGRGHRYVLVCHYNPSGNKVMITPKGSYALPAFTYRPNAGCSACPKGLKNCYKGKLCW